jgi:hypothetical protein
MALLQGQKDRVHDPMKILQKDLHGWIQNPFYELWVFPAGCFCGLSYNTTFNKGFGASAENIVGRGGM